MIGQISNILRTLSHCQPIALVLKLISRETLLKAVNVILRVPALFIAEIWLRTDPATVTVPILLSKSSDGIVDKAIRTTGTHDFVVQALYYLAIALAISLAFLPLKKLVRLYMHMVSVALLVTASYCSSLYVEEEKLANYQGSVLEDTESLKRAGVHIAIQVVVSATIGYLLNTSKWSMFLFAPYMLPVIARVGNYPVEHLHRVHNFATLFEILIITYFLFHVVPKVLDSIKMYAQRVSTMIQVVGWMPFVIFVWFNVALSLQFLTFWLVLFFVQTYRYLRIHDHVETAEGYIVMVLTCMAECCITPVTLFGLCVTISYVAFAVLTATRFFLTGRQALVEPGNATQRGYTEGFTMFLLALQTGLLELKTTQRAFLMCIVLFIVVSSLVQSMFEITDPVLLALGAAQNKCISKHLRAILLSTILWMFPLYMAWTISLFFDMDFWLMVVISSCILTSVQVMGSLVTYCLFVYDAVSQKPLENLDDFVFYAKATTRVLEFIVAVFVVCYGIRESLFGEWSWVNATILMIHCYFNVWQRLQVGWKSYLLRREASKKVESLRDATAEDLEELNDICSICYQQMSQAKITQCQHYFHTVCLRKWLYVQDNCPMCHQKIACEENEQRNNASTGVPNAGVDTEPRDEGTDSGNEGEAARGNVEHSDTTNREQDSHHATEIEHERAAGSTAIPQQSETHEPSSKTTAPEEPIKSPSTGEPSGRGDSGETTSPEGDGGGDA